MKAYTVVEHHGWQYLREDGVWNGLAVHHAETPPVPPDLMHRIAALLNWDQWLPLPPPRAGRWMAQFNNSDDDIAALIWNGSHWVCGCTDEKEITGYRPLLSEPAGAAGKE